MLVNVLSDQKEDGSFDHYVTFGDKAAWQAEDKDAVHCVSEQDAFKLKDLIESNSTSNGPLTAIGE
jgi:hypothetical protein